MSPFDSAGRVTGLLARTTFRSLNHRNYRLYFFGQLVSLTSTWMQIAALGWLAFALTGQARWTAYVMASHMIPAFLFGTLGGWLADHFPKLRLIILAQAGFLVVSALLAVITLAGVAEPWHLIVLMVAQGICLAIDLPARLSFVPSLIPRDDLINAVGLNSVLFNSARLLGPTVAGVVMATAASADGPGLCFLINTLTYLPVLAALRAIRVEQTPGEERPPPAGAWAALTGGFTALLRQPKVAAVLALAAAVALIGWPLQSLLPAFADRVLGQGDQAYSRMLAAVGFGALMSALAVATFGTAGRQRWFLLAGVTIIASSLHGLASATGQWSAVVSCVFFGMGMILFFPTAQSIVQLRAEEQLRGRTMAMWGLALSAAVPTGNLIFGPLADVSGVTSVIRGQAVAASAIGVGGLILALGVIRRKPRA